MPVKKQPENGTFDLSKYTLSNEARTVVLPIPETGDEIELKIKDLSWSKRNRLISKSLGWDAGGQVEFDGDFYVRECLKEMIVEAPWGRTSETFLISIDSRLGGALESLVPKAFGADENPADTVDYLKKEL